MKEFSRSLRTSSDAQSFLPVAAVYGPNAGGKSNLLEALGYVKNAVARPIFSLMRGKGVPEGSTPRLLRCSPFAFDAAHSRQPSEFEVYYRVGDYEYRYGLAVSASEIVSEDLFRRKVGASRSATLFN
ncbi:ATP-binding protein [Olsenella sp. DSM 107455]|uniref:ATP-binding protein n=1 Tax=Thermophilibacter gallinarum TaxID=2779357 RepID=A0ABR9QSE6_9ACTN|nr:AAA family ATPase [Thermophilibacter gallinarum]MBE5023996.1 ATP-binding protein [Thermophilibacter gallinarum]